MCIRDRLWVWWWPLLLAGIKLVTWLMVRGECNAARGVDFDNCALGLWPYGASEVLLLISLIGYGVMLLRATWRTAGWATAVGWATGAACIGLVSLLAWDVVALWGVKEAAEAGELSKVQKVLRSTLSISAIVGFFTGLFTMSIVRFWNAVITPILIAPVRRLLASRAGLERAPGSPVVTHTMDELGVALAREGIKPKDAEYGGERAAALWLLGQGSAPESIPGSASLEGQARWLKTVSKIIKNERSKGH